MHLSPDRAITGNLPSVHRRFVLPVAGLLVAVGAAVVGGWYAHNSVVVQILPSLVPMQFNTAVGFVASGVALGCLHRGRRLTARILAAGLVVLGVATLFEYVAYVDLGIDCLLVDPFTTTGVSHPGRMAPASALCFAFAGAAFLFLVPPARFLERPLTAALLAMLVATLGGLTLLG